MIELNSFFVKTNSSLIKCDIQIKEVNCSDLLKYVDKFDFDLKCKLGCHNYAKKWSCPPFAPIYMDFVSNYSKVLVVVISSELKQFSYIMNNYLKIKAANTIMKSRIDKVLHSFISSDRYYISTGSCRLCKPCKCKTNKPCAHPEKKSYSFEALGVNVSQMVKDLFDFELQWYKKNSLPQYTSVVTGLLLKKSIGEVQLLEKLL